MSVVQQTTFIIIREDRPEDPKTVVAEGLRIGRAPDSDIWLNHPVVSRLHAGINRIENDFYLINLSASSATTLNGRVVSFDEIEALADADEIQIGPFFLRIEEADDKLNIRVSLEFAVNAGERETAHLHERHQTQLELEMPDSGALRTPTDKLGTVGKRRSRETKDLSNAVKIFWGKRTREKAGRPSPLHPRTPPRPGKMRFNWLPTRDLVRPWPFALFVWAVAVVATLSTIAALAHKNAFAPNQPLSLPHARSDFALAPPIAKAPNGNSCSSCHAFGVSTRNREKMHDKCAACHQTENFVPSIIPAHREAGIGCTNCHAEHRGESFRPLHAALESCAKCHNDENENLYHGKRMHTPHGGTYGYPVENGKWKWKGLDAEELAQKPEVRAFMDKNLVRPAEPNEWRNAQFHGLHLNHVRVVPGVDGVADEDGNMILSCSSCHKTGYMGSTVDRNYPRTTCGTCHNAKVFNEPLSAITKPDTPSCTSCHVQHVRDSHWAASLRLAQVRNNNQQK